MKTDVQAPAKHLRRKLLKTYASGVQHTARDCGESLVYSQAFHFVPNTTTVIWAKQTCPAQTCPSALSFLGGGGSTGVGEGYVGHGLGIASVCVSLPV